MDNPANGQFPRGVEFVCGAVIEEDDGKVLFVKSPKWSDKWVTPGGHVEPGEKILDAIVREVSEETGLKVKPVDIVSFGELINSKDFHRPAHMVYLDVYCKAPDITTLKLDGRELTAHLWVRPDEALMLNLGEGYDKTLNDFIAYKNRKG
ncbi:ADP-ribose pyrophosphatase [uncultured archaeon]|nr:ADP-ribose pyrophosphatase [uncultured archaeon]